jgi:hypothetical protein
MIHNPRKKLEKLAMAILGLSGVVGCTVSARTGSDFDPSIVGRTLKPGIASQADVRAALGEPFGKGSAMMPFHDRPHLTWTYFADRSSVGISSGNMDERMKYLFVFFDSNRMDSYLWFTSTAQ